MWKGTSFGFLPVLLNKEYIFSLFYAYVNFEVQ